jgi:hypothetical protein
MAIPLLITEIILSIVPRSVAIVSTKYVRTLKGIFGLGPGEG